MMYNKLKKIFGCYFVIFISLSVQILAGDKETRPQDEVYVFYRGYHFLTGQEIDEATLLQKGISSRPVSNGDIPAIEIESAISKIHSLNRSWTEEEKIEFHSSCDTPYQELVQLYTNSYKIFIDELNDVNSNTRKILKLAGIENVKSNFFISTSLKSWQAYKYGSGLKLYKNEELRRYPCYSKETFLPQNPIIGYVDIIVIPKMEIRNFGAFFVVDSFAVGCTRLNHHFRKNLPEEMEVIFPFHIAAKYHVNRVPIRLPSLHRTMRGDGLQRTHWRGLISQATVEDQKKEELKLVESIIGKSSQDLDKKVTLTLKENRKARVYNGPVLAGMSQALIPADAIVIRNKIMAFEQQITTRYFNKTSHKFTIPIETLSFPLSYALKKIARSNYPMTIVANFSMESIKFDLMKIFLAEDAVVGLKFQGDPRRNLCEKFYALNIKENDVEKEADALWFNPDKAIVPNLVEISSARNQRLIVDVSGLGLAPDYLEEKAPELKVSLIDNERAAVDDAYTWVINGADWWGDYLRKEGM